MDFRILEDVAREYFHELVNRSFVIASARSSSGGIKSFHVHDLIRELCQTKCRDSNFFHMNHESALSSSSEPSGNNHYRVAMHKEIDVTNIAGSSLFDARTIQIYSEDIYSKVNYPKVPLKKLRLVQVLDICVVIWGEEDINEFTSLINLRYINAVFDELNTNSIPSSIFNLWNLMSLKLTTQKSNDPIHLPETIWRMKSLRYVKVPRCILIFPDDNVKHEDEADQILDKVVSFSKPVLSTVKDVERLLQRLPVVRKLSCVLNMDEEESIKTLDFSVDLESLKLNTSGVTQFMINFPSTLKELTLYFLTLSRTNLSAIAELGCLEVLRLEYGYFLEPSLEMTDLAFKNLKFFKLIEERLLEWNASDDTFPCLEQLVIECKKLTELPPCFREVSSLKRIEVKCCSPELESSVLSIQEELMDLGIQLEVSISKTYDDEESE